MARCVLLPEWSPHLEPALIKTPGCPQAQEDAEKLRSVVMPMEQEIAALKARLATSDDRVKELEASKVSDPPPPPQILRSLLSVSDPQIQWSLRSVTPRYNGL